MTQSMPLYGQILYADKVLDTVYLHKKFAACILICSKVIEWVPNFSIRFRDPDKAHFMG